MGFRVLSTTVEISYQESITAVFDRPELREWLKQPRGPLTSGGLIFIVDSGRRITLMLPDADPWPLYYSCGSRNLS